MYLVAAILKNGRHFEFWNFFRWLTGFFKRAISKEYVCQFWCLFPEMKDSYDILLLSAPLMEEPLERDSNTHLSSCSHHLMRITSTFPKTRLVSQDHLSLPISIISVGIEGNANWLCLRNGMLQRPCVTEFEDTSQAGMLREGNCPPHPGI